jgi:acetylornithine deacetylase/succinyl-diaminopimelate desuccinylase-like protein
VNTDYRAAVTAALPELQELLAELVRIPSISNTAFDQAPLEDSASRIAELFGEAGADDVQVLRADRPDGTPGAPAIVARFAAPPGAPTVMLYAHHDVQPIPDPAEWATEPFEPVVADGRMWGRGTADDKAGVVVHLGALRVLRDKLRVGVTVFIEGEEEIGSPSFVNFLNTYQDLLTCDVIVIADSANWAVGVPALTTSLRGLVDATVDVRVLEHAVHSGFFGGPVLDANVLAARLVATFHDDDGNVAVAGLTCAPDPDIDYEEAQFRADCAVLDSVRLAGTGPISARTWTRPALAIIGWDAVRTSEASNTIAPVTRIKVSLRVAPGQHPAEAYEALTRHIMANVPFGAEVTVTPGDLGQPFAAPADSPAMQAARAALSEAWGRPSVDIGVGGSIPFITDLLDIFPEASILVTGVEDPDSRAHGANESLHLADWANAILAEVLLLERLASQR